MPIQITNPADGRAVGQVPAEGAADVAAKITALRAAQPEWERIGPQERERWMRTFQRWLLDNSAHLADVIQSESAKPRLEAEFEVPMAASVIDYFAKNAGAFLKEEHPRPHSPLGAVKRVTTVYRPYPVIGVISPWNFPLLMPIYDAVPALAAGAAVILKPSEVTPLSALELVRGWNEIGAPGVLSVATGAGETGEAVVNGVDYVQFTGSTATGRAIAEACAKRLIPCGLELGGKDPAIVLADADLDRAAHGIAYGALLNSGQVCVAIERVYVEEAVYDQFVEKLVTNVSALRQGQDHRKPQHDLGALATEAQRDLVARQVDEAVRGGARVLTGGAATGVGTFYEPTILVDVTQSMSCVQDETFGPTIPVIAVEDENEAIALANDSRYGLSATVWSKDRDRANRVARQLDVGAVNINDIGSNFFALSAPMGGWKESGIGTRWGGASGVRKYCRQQVLTESRLPEPKREVTWFPYSARNFKVAVSMIRFFSTRRNGKLGIAKSPVSAEAADAGPNNSRSETLDAVRAIARSGFFGLPRLDRFVNVKKGIDAYGPVAGVIHAHAKNGVQNPAVIDDDGPVTYQEIDALSNALVRAWQADGLTADSVVGLVCRNHRGMIIAMTAAGKLGARIVLMNTGFAGSQLADVVARENVDSLVFDSEFADAAAAVPAGIRRYLAWDDGQAAPGLGTRLEEALAGHSTEAVPNPPHRGGITLLTSGTTGRPKGASRDEVDPLAPAQILDRVPFRVGQTSYAAAPLFHGTGLGLAGIAFALRNTVVLSRRFDAAAAVELIARHRCDSVVLVPTMLQRIINLGPEVVERHDTSSLSIIFSAGSALSPDLCQRTSELFGEVLYNMYGSTETAVIAIATPAELKLSPGTAGRSPVTCRLALLDADGHEITESGPVGRIFAGNRVAFAGYTDSGDKERIGGLVGSGDLGRYDAHGMLFVEGRSDDMVVSGGENVYPVEVENVIADRADIDEVAVFGVPDAEFGHRLCAFVVPIDGSQPDADDIKATVRSRLARYKVPRDVVFLDELPRNATGKVMRNKLLESFSD